MPGTETGENIVFIFVSKATASLIEAFADELSLYLLIFDDYTPIFDDYTIYDE
jgi:hypothetical protein